MSGGGLRHQAFGLLLSALALGTLAEPEPEPSEATFSPFTARYELSRNDIPVGETRVDLRRLPDHGYLYRARTEPNAVIGLFREDLILEESRGRLEDGQVQPRRYLYQRQGSDIERQLSLEFDWRRQRVRMRNRTTTWAMNLPPGTLDKLVQQWVFTRHMHGGGSDTAYQVADGGRLKDYHYTIVGEDSLDIPLGHFDTVKVQRHKDQGAADYTLWLAPKLDYQPVRILRRHQGAHYRMELAEFRRDG